MDKSLANLRKRAGYDSQEALAEVLGVQRVTISRWETGSREPNLKYIRKLSKLFCVPADDILVAFEFAKRNDNAS